MNTEVIESIESNDVAKVENFNSLLIGILEKNGYSGENLKWVLNQNVAELYIDKEDAVALINCMYEGQRRINWPNVRFNTEIIDDGYWIVGESLFVFTKCGRGINGNHRLHGFVASKKDRIKIAMRWNADLEEYLHMDSGRRRSDADASGYPAKLTEMTNFILKTANRAKTHRANKDKMYKALIGVYTFAVECKALPDYVDYRANAGTLAALAYHAVTAKSSEDVDYAYSQWKRILTSNKGTVEDAASKAIDNLGRGVKDYTDRFQRCEAIWFALSPESKTRVRRTDSKNYASMIKKSFADFCASVLDGKQTETEVE